MREPWTIVIIFGYIEVDDCNVAVEQGRFKFWMDKGIAEKSPLALKIPLANDGVEWNPRKCNSMDIWN